MSTLKSINVQHPSSATINIVNDSSGNVTVGNNLTVTGTSTLTGAATVGGVAVVAAAPTATGNIPFSTNGTTWSSTAKIVLGTAVASTSGTSIDFTGIPSWVKRVTVMFSGVSTNGSSFFEIRIGAGSIVTSGYVSSASGGTSANVLSGTTSTSGFAINAFQASTYIFTGTFVLLKIDGNNWIESGILNTESFANAYMSSGRISLGGTLDRVRITTVNGTDTFDAGTINILYE
jgi:hypothetical protein